MKTLASSFADPADLAAYAKSGTFAKGDNGKGCWGDITAQEHTPMCALPPDDIIAKWGGMTARRARGRKVTVTANGRTITCILADRMPWKRNIRNGAGIDLNPAAAKQLDLHPPFLIPANWQWAEDQET